MNDFLSFFQNKVNNYCIITFFILRLFFLLAIGNDIPVSTDYEVRYRHLAENIIYGEKYGVGADMVYPPLYPLFIAMNMLLFESHLLSIKVIQIIFDLVICVLIYLIGISLWDRKVGLIAMNLWGVYPIAMWQTSLVATETLFTLLILLFLLSLINSYSRKSIKYASVSGVFLGLAMLTRPLLTYFPMIIPIIYWKKLSNMNRVIYFYFIMLMSFFVTLTPWAYLNYVNYNKIEIGTIFSDGQGPGRLFFEGSDEDFVFANGDTRYKISDQKRDSLYLKYQNSGLSKNEILIKTAKEKIISNPLLYLKIVIFKIWKLLTFTITGTYDLYIKIINVPLVFLALFGIFSFYRRYDDFLPLFFLIAYIICIYSLLISMFRYFVPVFPIVILFSASGIDRIFLKYLNNYKTLEI